MKILKRLSNENIECKEQLNEPKLKPLLHPLSDRKKTIEKIEIECDTDKVEDNEYLNSLSQNELAFYRNKTSGLYYFLIDINLVRYIDDFIQDGFETENDLLLIKEDYFEENKSFDHIQQKKIMNKVKELSKPKKETCEFGTNTNDNNGKENYLSSLKCWNCLNSIRNGSCVSQDYQNGLIKEKIVSSYIVTQLEFLQ